MPLEHQEAFERHEKVSLRGWKGGEVKVFNFLDDGKDVDTPQYGIAYLYLVENKAGKTMELWIAPKSPLAIGLAPFAPSFKGRTLKITKTTGKAQKDTRYTIEETS